MRSSRLIAGLVLLAFVLVGASAYEKCPNCGLGEGEDPCPHHETVVKAAKLQKPAYLASPEAINYALKYQQATGYGPPIPGYGAPVSPYAIPGYGYGGVYGASPAYGALAAAYGAYGAGLPYGSNKAHLTNVLDPASQYEIGDGGKTYEELQQLLYRQPGTPVAPLFKPIGDLCHPNGKGKQYGSTYGNAKGPHKIVGVTPAYPGKTPCKCPPPAPPKVYGAPKTYAPAPAYGSAVPAYAPAYPVALPAYSAPAPAYAAPKPAYGPPPPPPAYAAPKPAYGPPPPPPAYAALKPAYGPPPPPPYAAPKPAYGPPPPPPPPPAYAAPKPAYGPPPPPAYATSKPAYGLPAPPPAYSEPKSYGPPPPPVYSAPKPYGPPPPPSYTPPKPYVPAPPPPPYAAPKPYGPPPSPLYTAPKPYEPPPPPAYSAPKPAYGPTPPAPAYAAPKPAYGPPPPAPKPYGPPPAPYAAPKPYGPPLAAAYPAPSPYAPAKPAYGPAPAPYAPVANPAPPSVYSSTKAAYPAYPAAGPAYSAKPVYPTGTNYGHDDDDDALSFAEQEQLYKAQPTIPADPVSISLAYKNFLQTPTAKKYVPEDRLAFGHRQQPADGSVHREIANVPEEKLLTVDKPIVELKAPARCSSSSYGGYTNRYADDDGYGDLEALERETEAASERARGAYVSYSDLGYGPVSPVANQFVTKTDNVPGYGAPAVGYAAPAAAAYPVPSVHLPCGPLGPTVPGYKPGAVLVEEKPAKTYDDGYGSKDESDEYGSYSSEDTGCGCKGGIIERLKPKYRKHKQQRY